MSQRVEWRPVLAAILSLFQPGFGHLYLREWLRAALWAALWFGSLGVVVATAEIELSTAETLAALVGAFAFAGELPTGAVASMLAVTAFATLDAYWLAARNNRRLGSDVGRCPRCGRELDPSLEFCHWCTAVLSGDESA